VGAPARLSFDSFGDFKAWAEGYSYSKVGEPVLFE
jgi:hypothetical protein